MKTAEEAAKEYRAALPEYLFTNEKNVMVAGFTAGFESRQDEVDALQAELHNQQMILLIEQKMVRELEMQIQRWSTH